MCAEAYVLTLYNPLLILMEVSLKLLMQVIKISRKLLSIILKRKHRKRKIHGSKYAYYCDIFGF